MNRKDTLKINRAYIRRFRHAVQWAVLLMVVYAGFAFYHFVGALEQGAVPSFSRPPSVEGFLPIGGLMALKLWITEGIFDTVHPASIVILCGALILSFLLRKSFCGWICPVGTVSEAVWKTGKRIFGKNYVVPKYADYLLRSIKYILMSFFLYIILIKMSPSDIAGFIGTPYWKVVDIKMLKFFTEISPATAVILGVIILLSFICKNVWCRYLCPYGALLGLLGCISPVGISRNDEACIALQLMYKELSVSPRRKQEAQYHFAGMFRLSELRKLLPFERGAGSDAQRREKDTSCNGRRFRNSHFLRHYPHRSFERQMELVSFIRRTQKPSVRHRKSYSSVIKITQQKPK